MNYSNTMLSYNAAFNLCDNAFNFVEPAIQILKRFEDSIYSYDDYGLRSAILSVTTGVELLLKAKIAVKDWRELFQSPNKAEGSKFLSGEFYSVKLEECVPRIEKLYAVQISQHHKTGLDHVRRIRNKLVHFYYDADRYEFIILIATCIDIFIEFYREFILNEFSENRDRTSKIDDTLKDVKEYVQIRLRSISTKLNSSVRPLTYHLSECGNCGQDTYVIKDSKEINCLFCGLSYVIEEKAKERSENGQAKECPTCHIESMFSNSGSDSWECMLCGYYTDTPTRFILRNEVTTSDSRRLEVPTDYSGNIGQKKTLH